MTLLRALENFLILARQERDEYRVVGMELTDPDEIKGNEEYLEILDQTIFTGELFATAGVKSVMDAYFLALQAPKELLDAAALETLSRVHGAFAPPISEADVPTIPDADGRDFDSATEGARVD